ncbi:glycosyltransferase family 4 protein [Aerococcus urinaeequi]|uniref:glycosyltransferase family 4 protein n=1 Tax=Aerococcus urinaeequi TaxID=51665 RepID=UPI00288D819C|nr:glycosyltransferase family 4 protein [Aerococcus urinaeequi]MDT2761851.1 glycosyltransferase family 4 protein [Aerococcus urinaeequi]
MRILRLSRYIYNCNYKQHSNNKSGFGRSVWDIARFSAKNNNTEFLFTYNNSGDITSEDVNLINGKKYRILNSINFATIYNTLKSISTICKYKKSPIKKKASVIYYNLFYGYLLRLISKYNPDIIHIHGLTHSTYPFIMAAEKSNVPFIVTLHGLNMDVTNEKIDKEFEIDSISRLNSLGTYITVIGSGMKRKILETCDIKFPEKLITINHGIDYSDFNLLQDKKKIKKQLGIENKEVVLTVGSLTENKNQKCLIEAISLMTQERLESLVVLIVGEGPQKKYLEEFIDDYGLSNNVFLLGQKNIDELSQLYSIADLTAVLSKVEGFGRPILESFIFGVPVISFEDLDAVNDLYKDGCLFTMKNRAPGAVCDKIIEVLSTSINTEKIKAHSKSKTWEAAIERYNIIYEQAISDKNKNIKLEREL